MFCHAEVSQRDVAIVIENNVAGFDVPVHDVHVVHFLDSEHLSKGKAVSENSMFGRRLLTSSAM